LVLRPVGRAKWGVPFDELRLVIRFTRHWIHYGILTHVFVCTLIAAIEGVIAR